MPQLSSLHEAALQYAAAGMPVFPCAPGEKTPLSPRGFHDATVDREQINRWWAKWPDANIAFTPQSMGWGIVDIDSPEAEAAYAERNHDSPPTWSVRSPRGGLHLYYEGELPTSVRTRVIPGLAIDTRGKGSYALLPPSRTPDGTYQVEQDSEVVPIPEWVSQAIKDTERGGAIIGAEVELDLPANIDRARAFLQNAAPAIEGQGGNQRTYVVASELRGLGISRDTALGLMDDWNERCEPPWDRDELETVVTNAYTYAQNTPGIHAASEPSEAFRAAVANLPDDLAGPAPRRSRFYPEDETEQEEGKDPQWLIPDLLPDGASVMVQGATQSYKSFIALDLVLSIASNTSTFAGPIRRPGPVFYAALEGRTDLKKKRRRAWKAARQVDAVPDFYTMPAPLVAVNEECEEFAAQIERRLSGRHCAGIVIDTAAKAMAGLNENDARDAGMLVQFVDRLKEQFRCPVLVIFHLGKDAARGGRGSSAFHAGFDTVVEVTADRNVRMVTVQVLKHKDAEEPEQPWYLEGHKVAQSLAFQPVTKAEYTAATQAESHYGHGKIGAALKRLKAYGDQVVTTYVLANALLDPTEGESPEVRQKKLASITGTLTRLAKDQLSAYVTDGLWGLPATG
jgi:Bifunctional DNA primase/polymerase, N-terminal/AAA domain